MLPRDSLAYYLHQLMFFIGGIEHKVGIILILIALSVRYIGHSHFDKLVLTLGGAKEVYLISTCLSAIFLVPIAVVIVWIDQYLVKRSSSTIS